jgi:hypothetical protein
MASITDRINNPDREAPRKVSAAQIRLWNALCGFIQSQGAQVVSLPGFREIRIEVPKDSGLAAKLTELGYQPHHLCAETRIKAGKFESVDVISIVMPGK